MARYPTPWLNLSQQSDVTANDSDKSFTVPSTEQWRVFAVHVKLVTTATAGNRLIYLDVTDGTNTLATYQAGAVQAASLTRYYFFACNHPQETSFTNTIMLRVIPTDFWLPSSYVLRVYDVNAIDPAADDMDVRIIYQTQTE